MVRHGQASFGQTNYDKLSEMGERQSSVLGKYWADHGVKLDAVYSGTLARQTKTCELAKAEYERAGLDFPDMVEMPAFNEYDTAGILSGSVPEIMASHPEIMKLMKELAPDGEIDLKGNKKTFQRMFGQVMDLWVEGKIDVDGLESWQDFYRRVTDGLKDIMEKAGSGKNIAVFTSGGPISAAMQMALSTPDKVSMSLGWVIMNTSVSEFMFSGPRFTLSGFNCRCHLTDDSLLTYR